MKSNVSKQLTVRALHSSLRPAGDVTGKIQNRLDVLNRMAFPIGWVGGKGFRGGYTVEQFWQLVMVFHVMRTGVATGAAVEMVRESWALAHTPIMNAVAERRSDRSFWVLRPAGLPELEPFVETGMPQRSIETFVLEPHSKLQDALAAWDLTHCSLIDANQVVRAAMEGLIEADAQFDIESFKAATTAMDKQSLETLRNLLKQQKVDPLR